MSEQRRNLSKWEYLIFSIKRESSSLRKWPIAKSRTTLLATLAGVVILLIISITLIYAFLPGSPPSATINDENPHITQFNTIALSIAQFKSLASRQTPPSSDKSAIVKGIIEKLSSNATGFAFEVDNGEDAEIHKYADPAAAIAALDSLLQNVVDRNPNQTNAVAVYRRALPNDQQIQHSYTFFAAVPDDYASYEDFFNDMKTAVQELSALRDVHENVKAILVSTADMTNITGDSGIHVVTDVEGDNDHMVDVIANDIAESPPIPSPHCFGDFIFVVDGSTDISQSLIWAVRNITANWNFNGIRKLRVSAAGSGLSEPYDGYYVENFASTSNDWSCALARMGMAVNIFNKGNVTPPTSLATTLEDTYCKEDSINPILKGTNVTIIIFTSWSDDSLIDQMTSQQRPWLSCSLASRTTVFMVGICNAASNLRRLALPSEDLYIDMEYFKFTSMNDLVNKVIAKTCDCATQGS
uniref:VWFA domain-containing protein n=1 Tax=Parascaris univalens TaxID=6257 RepID=A0A915AMS8_PARUN